MLGRRFVLIEHVGRTSGLRRRTVLEVIRCGDRSLDVAAAWGSKSDWFRNVSANPSVVLSTGGLREAPATASVLDRRTAAGVFETYANDHRLAARQLGRVLGLDFSHPESVAASVPVVRFTLD